MRRTLSSSTIARLRQFARRLTGSRLSNWQCNRPARERRNHQANCLDTKTAPPTALYAAIQTRHPALKRQVERAATQCCKTETAIINQLIIGIVYSAIILSLIWARLRFFKITSKKSKLVSYLNDPAVFVQLAFTYGLLWQAPQISTSATIAVVAVYSLALALFWWAIKTAKGLHFAAGDVKGQIVSSGAFGLVRHPFYVSYMMVWIASSALLGSLFLWASCVVLIAMYVHSAREEEAGILAGELGAEYQAYRVRTGMFVPRVLGL